VLRSNSGVEFDYNALGQQVAQRENGQETRYFWNEQGMLARVVLPNGEEWTYRYDPLGRRVEKRGPKERIEFIWDGDVVLHEIRTTEGRTEAPIHWEFDPYGFAPIGKIERGQHYLCVNNINGAPQELRAQDGHTAWSATFTTSDEESGLCYNRFRYYNPANIKYISADPIGIFGGTNTFSYPTNSLQWIDPLGLTGSCPVLDMSLVKTSTGETRDDHIRTHEHDKPNKPDHGVFMEDGVAATHEAWQKGHEQGIAIQSNGFFEVPMGRDVGLAGGQSGLAANHPLLNGVRIILQPGTNKLITAYPIYIPTS
jgi:RHS repeat-associated protein